MKIRSILVIWIIICTSSSVFSIPLSFEQNYNIPSWVKNNAKWWSQGQVGDSDFEKGIEYLVGQKIINIPPQNQTTSGATAIPSWVKNIASMWTSGQVSDNDFLKGIEYLVRIGLIHVNIAPTQTSINTTPNIPTTPSVPNTSPLATTPITTPSTPTNSISTSNTTKSIQNILASNSANNQNVQSNTDSLVGNGVILKINGNVASGFLTFSGIQYTAPSLMMIKQGSQIQLQGNVQTTSTFLLEVVGIVQSGNQYNFYGTISNNGKSIPIQFTATLAQGNSQPTTQASHATNSSSTATSTLPQPVTKPQVPTLPMLVLYAQSQQVTMGYPYNLAVKIFDPKTNPDKAFDQFYGGISGATINGTILDQNNQKLSSFSGLTDKNGLYQYQVLAPYYKGWMQTFKVILNATKSGYAPQSLTFSFLTLYPNQGGAAACTSAIPSAPTSLSTMVKSSTEVDLSWTGSTGATGYNILRSTNNGGPYVEISTSASASFSDTTVTHLTTYYYVVQATNCAGASSDSNQAFATP